MRFSIVITALVSAITVSAMPTISSNQPEICFCDPSTDGATLFKKSRPTTCGPSTDFVTIPVGGGCINMSSFYSTWENATHALVVAMGQKCEFYTEPDCPPTHDSLCLGSKVESIIRKTLPKRYQGSIMSAECNKL